MSWDHYLPRWVLRAFRDPDGNYYTLHRGATKSQLKSLNKTGARKDMNKTTAPDGTILDTEPYWTQWDEPAGVMASKVTKGERPATDLATVVIWATSLPLRAPFWRDALEQATNAHDSNAGALYFARAFLAPQVAEAVGRDSVTSEILVAPEKEQFISGDCGCVFMDHQGVLQAPSASVVLPWDVASFESAEPDPGYSSPPKALAAFASITPAIALHFQFVPQGQGGDEGIRTLNASETDQYNRRFVTVAKDELYGTQVVLDNFVGQF